MTILRVDHALQIMFLPSDDFDVQYVYHGGTIIRPKKRGGEWHIIVHWSNDEIGRLDYCAVLNLLGGGLCKSHGRVSEGPAAESRAIREALRGLIRHIPGDHGIQLETPA